MKVFSAVARLMFAALMLAPVTAKADPSPAVAAYLWSSLNPSTVGDPVTFSTLVLGSGAVPTGTVTFKKYGTTDISSALTVQTIGAGAPIGAGYHHTCYVTAAGGVKCSGGNDKGQLGDGTTTESHAFIDVVGLSGPAIGVSVGRQNTCAILADSTAMCWGNNSDGQLGNGSAGDSNAHGTPTAVTGLADVKSIALGDNHTCAITNKGKLYCWGQNISGQLGTGGSSADQNSPVSVPSLTKGVVAVTAGQDFSCALTDAGGVKCWGGGFYLVGGGTIATPTDVTGLTSGVAAIGGGRTHNCAALAAGGAKCWGDDHSMQLGDGTTGDANGLRTTPVAVLNMSDVLVAIIGGYSQTCALTSGAAVYCWGSQQGGQLGDGQSGNTNANATLVTGLSGGVTSLFTGYAHACAGLSDGSIRCWGWDFNGQQGDGGSSTNSTPVVSAPSGSMLGIASASMTTSSLVADTTPITAVYSGDTAFTGTTSNEIQQSIQGLTSTTVITSNTPNPSVAGATITVNVTVSGSSTPPNGGSITLKDNNTDSVAFGSVTNGSASMTVSTLDVGVHTLTAYFSGDNVYNSSFSSGVSQTVQGATSVALTATPRPAKATDTITLTATVSPTAPATGTPTGNVTFKDGAVTLGTVALTGGVAQTTTSLPNVGPHIYAATYDGDGTYLTSSNTTNLSVRGTVGAAAQVNTTVGGSQQMPAVVALKSGYLITWASDGQDGAGFGIFGQRYSNGGGKLGSEFQVNTTVTGNQSHPASATQLSGNFVVVWQSQGQDTSGYGIYGQRFTLKGVKSGGEFRINTTKTADQTEPAIAAMSDGGIIVVWTSAGQDGSAGGIYAQRYQQNGLRSGNEFKVNTTTVGDQSHPSVAALGTGFVVTWQGPDASGLGILAQRFDASSNPLGAEMKVNTVTANDQSLPVVTTLASGDFVIAWQSDLQDGSGLGIYMQRYNAAGARQGGAPKRVSTKIVGDQGSPSIAAFSDTGFVVTWTSDGQDGSGQGIYGQVFDATGTPVNVELRINPVGAGDQTQPSVAAFASGNFVVGWTSDGQDGSAEGVYAQRMSVPHGD